MMRTAARPRRGNIGLTIVISPPHVVAIDLDGCMTAHAGSNILA